MVDGLRSTVCGFTVYGFGRVVLRLHAWEEQQIDVLSLLQFAEIVTPPFGVAGARASDGQ